VYDVKGDSGAAPLNSHILLKLEDRLCACPPPLTAPPPLPL